MEKNKKDLEFVNSFNKIYSMDVQSYIAENCNELSSKLYTSDGKLTRWIYTLMDYSISGVFNYLESFIKTIKYKDSNDPAYMSTTELPKDVKKYLSFTGMTCPKCGGLIINYVENEPLETFSMCSLCETKYELVEKK